MPYLGCCFGFFLISAAVVSSTTKPMSEASEFDLIPITEDSNAVISCVSDTSNGFLICYEESDNKVVRFAPGADTLVEYGDVDNARVRIETYDYDVSSLTRFFWNTTSDSYKYYITLPSGTDIAGGYKLF